MKSTKLMAVMLVVGMSVSAMAGVGYTDARVGVNTFSDTDPYYAIPHVSGDNLWSERANAGWGADGLVVNSSGEDSPLIYTVIDGLTAGTQYYVDAVFVSGSAIWPIRAGLASDSLTLFTRDGSDVQGESSTAGTLYYDNTGSAYDAYAGALGIATADGNGELKVYVDDLPYTADGNYRTWYDGVNVAEVPEPATLALLGLGSLLLRRKK